MYELAEKEESMYSEYCTASQQKPMLVFAVGKVPMKSI